MKKYQKLYQLKQIVKADQESSKYWRLTRKKVHPIELDAKRNQCYEHSKSLTKDIPITNVVGRRMHIAYSLLKGKTYPQVENSVKQENKLVDWQWKKIVEIISYFKDEENTCIIPSEPFPTTIVNTPRVKEVTE